MNTFEGTLMIYNNGQVMYYTQTVGLQLKRHWKKMKFNITEILGNNIILGILWLRQRNSQIDWASERIPFGWRLKIFEALCSFATR